MPRRNVLIDIDIDIDIRTHIRIRMYCIVEDARCEMRGEK